MVEVKWTDQALKDIDSIAAFIARDSENFAALMVQRFFEAAEILNTFPKSGRYVPEADNKKIREIIVGKYRIMYVILIAAHIDVLTVHHSARILRKGMLKRKPKK